MSAEPGKVAPELSACCGAPVTVEGDTTQHWQCQACGKPCDLCAPVIAADPDRDPAIALLHDCEYCGAKAGEPYFVRDAGGTPRMVHLPHYSRMPDALLGEDSSDV